MNGRSSLEKDLRNWIIEFLLELLRHEDEEARDGFTQPK